MESKAFPHLTRRRRELRISGISLFDSMVTEKDFMVSRTQQSKKFLLFDCLELVEEDNIQRRGHGIRIKCPITTLIDFDCGDYCVWFDHYAITVSIRL